MPGTAGHLRQRVVDQPGAQRRRARGLGGEQDHGPAGRHAARAEARRDAAQRAAVVVHVGDDAAGPGGRVVEAGEVGRRGQDVEVVDLVEVEVARLAADRDAALAAAEALDADALEHVLLGVPLVVVALRRRVRVVPDHQSSPAEQCHRVFSLRSHAVSGLIRIGRGVEAGERGAAMTVADEDWRAANRANWDERVAVHLRAPLYDLAALRAGRSRLNAIEEAELGPVAGLRVLHLQCHFGSDSLRLAQRGAEVVGLDFSPRRSPRRAGSRTSSGSPGGCASSRPICTTRRPRSRSRRRSIWCSSPGARSPGCPTSGAGPRSSRISSGRAGRSTSPRGIRRRAWRTLSIAAGGGSCPGPGGWRAGRSRPASAGRRSAGGDRRGGSRPGRPRRPWR